MKVGQQKGCQINQICAQIKYTFMFSNSLYIYNAFTVGPTRPRDNQSRFRVCNALQFQNLWPS